jgi:hypothetical protein
VQTPKFTDAELARINRNACLAGWKKAQVQANLRHLSLAAQTRYYTGLKNVEPNDQPQHRNKFQEKKPTNHRPKQGSQARNKSKKTRMKKVTTHRKNIVKFTENIITQLLSVRSFKSIKPNIKVGLVTKIVPKIMSN